MSFKKLLSSFLISAGVFGNHNCRSFWNNFNEVKGAPSNIPAGSVRVSGEAWSSNIGWIKFDPSYGGVFYNQTTGNLSGYAWSSNIGWIKFENLSANPEGIGGASAKVDSPSSLTSSTVSGWARVCAGNIFGDLR